MDPSDGKSSNLERRASGSRSVRLSAAVGNDDDFALEAMGISDGFRPSQEPSHSTSSGTATPANSLAPQIPRQQTPELSNAQSSTTPSPPTRPSSIAKTRQNEPLSLRHDGQMGPVSQRALARDSTASSVNPFITTEETPYTGPSGPSFPYQMYPQNIRSNRTASVATASTAAPPSERSYNGPRGPTHPYGIYPQNTAGDEERERTRVVAPAIQVGFPGAADQYRRRIGPEGDDAADLIGPDGHTEALPPYTRYANETYAPKPPDAQQTAGEAAAAAELNRTQPTMQVQNNVAATLQPQQSTAGGPAPIAAATAVPTAIAGAGGMGLATRNPEFSSSTDDLGSARSRYSAQSFGSQASSHEINTAAAATATDADNEKAVPKWKQKARKKLWGIVPYWAICLVFTVLILVGIILGAVIGTFLSKHKPPPHKEDDHEAEVSAIPATVTVTLDATPLSTLPANLTPLDEGDYALPIVAASRSSKSCFNNTLQSNAWSCTVIFSQLMMSVNKLENNPDTNNYSVNLSCNQSLTINSNTFSYGTQPPCFNRDATMELVTDIYEPNRGPAWFFQMPYEKVVILPESFLSIDDDSETVTTSEDTLLKERFNGDGVFGADDFKRKGVANPGEKPWICKWGGTLLEVFVYANQSSNSYRGYTSMFAEGASYMATATENPFANSPSPTSSKDEGSMSKEEAVGSVHIYESVSDEATTTITATTTVTNPIGSETTDPNASTTYAQWNMDGPQIPPAPYPRVVKVEERRMSGPPSEIPICQQWEILESGRRAARDENGDEVIIEIGETEREPTLVNIEDLLPEETTSADSEKKKAKRMRIDPSYLEKRTGGAYYVDETGALRERDDDDNDDDDDDDDDDFVLVGQDLSDCGCLWWTL
ncbi:hypothetical protein MKZ38_009569 [Zalerion maritima]|uniref:DUF7820 domain-containing protein n=1 Tax=Zalerion maritima TaxID=339359 RepID=A0AAD5RTA9_9PEZI|nr:hypothetical protein MKZ38_009569 [Zalerion maritima]